MQPSTNRRVALLVGVLLVSVPLWAPALDVTGPDYTYRSVELTSENGRLVPAGEERPNVYPDQIEPFDCFPYERLQRSCLLEGATIERNVTGVNPTVRVTAGSVPVERGNEYVAFSWNGSVYRRTTAFAPEERDEDGLYPARYVLGLERVPAGTALADVARPLGDASGAAVAAVETGRVSTDEPLAAAGDVVATDGRYYLIYGAGRSTTLSSKPLAERVLEGVCVLAGVAVLLRGT